MNNEIEKVVAVLDNSSSTGERKLENEVTAIEVVAEKFAVSNDSQYAEAGAFGRALKSKMAEVTEFFAPLKKSAHDAHKQICDREKKMLEPLKNAESILKKAMGEYAFEKERKRKEAEEEARRLAKEEAERKLAESRKAEEKGDVKTAAMAKLDAEIAKQAACSIVIDDNKLEADGVSTSTDWEIESIDESVVPVSVKGMTIRPVDTSAVMKLIRASKGTIEIDGIKYKEIRKLSFRR